MIISLHASRTAAVWLSESPATVAETQLRGSGRRRKAAAYRPLYSPPAPAASVVTAAAANQPEQQQKDNGPDKGVDDQSDDPNTEVNTKLRQQPIADEGADQTDQQIADQSEPATLHHPARQISCDNSDNDDHEKALIGQVHDFVSREGTPGNAYR